MKVLNILTAGNAGGIESLCRDIGLYSPFQNGFCFLFNDGVIYNEMKNLGLQTYCLKNTGKSKVSLSKIKLLKKIAREYDIIVVHHGDIFLKFYHWILSKILDKKFVTVVHSCYEERYFFPGSKLKKVFGHMVFQAGLNISDLIVFVSNAGLESYKSVFKFEDTKAKIVYNGIGLDKIVSGEKAVVNYKTPYNLTYIGRLSSVKGIDLLLYAAAKISFKYPICVSIIGAGDDLDRLKQITKEINMEDKVTFYGAKTDVKPYLNEASIFVYPSIWQEVFGISLVEAMAFGRPCIANRVGGIAEIIQDGVSGYLTDSPTSDALANTLERVIKDIKDGTVQTISENAKQRAKVFSIQNTVLRLKQLYEEL